MSKREADSATPDAKQAKVAHTMNINHCVDKAFENKTLKEIAKAKVSAIEGVGEKLEEMLSAMHCDTIEQLANWKFFKVARAIVALAATEEAGKRPADSSLNINHILDKDYEHKSLKELVDAPPSALQGLADWTDSVLKVAHITTIGKLAEFKYALWAESIVELAKFETEGGAH